MRLLAAIALLAAPMWSQTACSPPMPCYHETGLVNGASFLPDMTPGALVSLFGNDVAWETRGLYPEDGVPGLAGVHVLVNNIPAVVIWVSPLQINFLLPPSMQPGPATVRLIRNGAYGPLITVTLREFAPALFQFDSETAAALRHPDWRPVTREYPVAPGDIVSLWGTGMGPLERPVPDLEIPQEANQIAARRQLRVLLNGIPLPDNDVLYAGCGPGYYGLYQVNIRLPADIGPDPEVRIAIGDYISPAGVRLRVR